MPTVVIQLSDSRRAFEPHETIAGQVSWQCDTPLQSAELHLRWSTDGRGIEDEGLVQTIPFLAPQAIESRPFTLTLPEAPYSFSGALITLSWSLEVVIQPGDQTQSIGITVAPEGKVISLPRVDKKV